MALTGGERIDLISEVATVLDKREWPDIDLILEQHDLPTQYAWASNEKRGYVIEMVKGGSDDKLRALHHYLTGQLSAGRNGASPWQGDRLRLFLSHLSTQRIFVSDVSDELAKFGIESFVAHEAIKPSSEWQDVIEASLQDCDALVAFLHEAFAGSKWCDQEVGWIMGRNRPILSLSFDTHPHGFLAKYQAMNCSKLSAKQIANAIFEWLLQSPTVKSRVSSSVVHAFADSSSFSETRRLSAVLSKLEILSDANLDVLEQASKNNMQISNSRISGIEGPQWVSQFVGHRR